MTHHWVAQILDLVGWPVHARAPRVLGPGRRTLRRRAAGGGRRRGLGCATWWSGRGRLGTSSTCGRSPANWETRLVERLPEELAGSLPTVEEMETELGRRPDGGEP